MTPFFLMRAALILLALNLLGIVFVLGTVLFLGGQPSCVAGSTSALFTDCEVRR